MSIQHTPGPWWAAQRLSQQGELGVYAADGALVAVLPNQPNHEISSVDNAVLIAAAPRLLAALRGVLDLMENWHALEGTPSMTEQFGEARKAIAQAEGVAV